MKNYKFLLGLLCHVMFLNVLASEHSFYVKFDDERVVDSLRLVRRDLTMTPVFPYVEKYAESHRSAGLHLWYEVTVDAKRKLTRMMQSFDGVQGVRKVEPQIELRLPDETNSVALVEHKASRANTLSSDPLFPEQWDLRTGVVGSVDAESAWEIERGKPTVIVAVMDQLVDAHHPDLVDNMWRNEAEINGVEGVDDDGNGYVDDYHGVTLFDQSNLPGNHGTHVAGVIAARGGNGTGIAGIAGGYGEVPGVRIMTCGLLRSKGGNTVEAADLAKMYVYAADNGAVISQNSWAGGSSEILSEAVNYFMDNAGNYAGSPMKGGLVVWAAGNDNSSEPASPETHPLIKKENLIIVSSVSADGDKASYSNYGNWVDIAAPGGEFNFCGVLSTIAEGRYGYMMGTSMACPHVSGIAALVVSRYGNGQLTPAIAKERILYAAREVNGCQAGRPQDGLMGVGIADAYRALLDAPTEAPDAPADFKVVQNTSDWVELSWRVPADSRGVAVANCILTDDKSGYELSHFDTHRYSPGYELHYFVDASVLTFPCRLSLKAEDSSGNVSASTKVILMSQGTGPALLNPYDTGEFLVYQYNDFYQHHPNGLKLSFPVSAPSGMKLIPVVDDSGKCVDSVQLADDHLSVSINPTATTLPGVYPLVLSVADAVNPSVASSISLSYRVRKSLVHPIPAPVLVSGAETEFLTGSEQGTLSFSLREWIADPSGLDFWCASMGDLIYGDFSHGLTVTIDEADMLHADYRFNPELLDFDNDKIDIAVTATNSYGESATFHFILRYQEGASVAAVETEQKRKGIYTLTGIRVDSNPEDLIPGFYIVDGEKTFVR